MTYQDRFRDIIARMHRDENSEKYNSINTNPIGPDANRIWKICQKMWGTNFNATDGCNVSNDLDPIYAHRLLDELEGLLNKLGWK